MNLTVYKLYIYRSYGVWMRWGRIGYAGQMKWHPASNLEAAKSIFQNKFKVPTTSKILDVLFCIGRQAVKLKV